VDRHPLRRLTADDGARSAGPVDGTARPTGPGHRAGGTVRAVSRRPSAKPVSSTRSPKTRTGSARPAARPTPRVTGRRRARRGEGDLLREEILDATTELLIELGSADKVSTRAVAQRVGCSSPALYLHFPDKATLVYATCQRQFQTLGQLIDAAVAAVDDPVERLRVAARVYTTFAIEHPEQYRVMMMDSTYGGLYQASLEELGAESGMASLLAALTDGIERGIFAPGDPALMAVGLWASIHGMASLALAKPGIEWPPAEELVDRLLAQFLHGLLRR
jgi:AcrR family transcriptional regulator